jgi:hypothetical protein
MLSKKCYQLPDQIYEIYPPLTREKIRYKAKMGKLLNLPFSYNSRLFIMDYENEIEELKKKGWGKVLDGGVFEDRTFIQSISSKYPQNRYVFPKGTDGEWVAFEFGLFLNGASFKIGPIPYDSIISYSFVIKPHSVFVWAFTKRDAVISILITDDLIDDNSKQVSFNLCANSPNIQNLSKILDCVAVVKK